MEQPAKLNSRRENPEFSTHELSLLYSIAEVLSDRDSTLKKQSLIWRHLVKHNFLNTRFSTPAKHEIGIYNNTKRGMNIVLFCNLVFTIHVQKDTPSKTHE